MTALIATLALIAAAPQGLAPPIVDPARPAAGAEVRVTQVCASRPDFIIEQLTIPAIGASPNWRFSVPATIVPKVYTLRWKCGTAIKDLASIEVLTVTPRVVGISNYKRDERVQGLRAEDRSGKAVRDRLRDVLKIKVQNLTPWRALGANARIPLHLYLDGAELKNVVAEPAPNDPADGPEISSLRVLLEIDDKDSENRRAWVVVLNAALARDDRKVALTVGPAGAPFPSAETLSLDVFPSYTWSIAVFLGLVALVVIVLGRKSNLLRDFTGATPAPYSLARHQMAVWFVVIVGSYLYVWLITGAFASISTTALTLIGISGATGLVAVTMDQSKRNQAIQERAERQAEHDALHAEINGPTGLRVQEAATGAGSPQRIQILGTIGEKEKRLNELAVLLGQPVPAAATSQGWYLDLLSDDKGVSFHRLQMAIWTLVLVLVFVRSVVADILMPEFDTTLLGLLGISSGTYLGFKFPEGG